MNKIISMSVWGSNQRYIEGARRQIELATKWYPDFKIKLFVDDKNRFINFSQNVEILKADTSTYGMFWRFEPLFEDDNNIVLVRDSDSRITSREAKAVREWLDSDKQFHTFKDHPAHFEFPIIGCAFGLKGKLNLPVHNIMLKYMKDHQYYLSDQLFLRDVVYPLVKDSAMVHSMNEGWFGESRKLLNNPYEFCGNGWDENDMPIYPPTLEECVGFNPANVNIKFRFKD